MKVLCTVCGRTAELSELANWFHAHNFLFAVVVVEREANFDTGAPEDCTWDNAEAHLCSDHCATEWIKVAFSAKRMRRAIA